MFIFKAKRHLVFVAFVALLYLSWIMPTVKVKRHVFWQATPLHFPLWSRRRRIRTVLRFTLFCCAFLNVLNCSFSGVREAGALSIRPNIPVWNSWYSMRRMEQYFPVRWTNQSQVIRFQVSRENTTSNRGLFYVCLLALGLLDDPEVEINDVLGEGDNITFIVRI